MKNFLVLYHSPAGAAEQMANMTPEQSKAVMDAWDQWMQANKDAMVDMGSPLGAAWHVTTDGVASGEATASGYSVMRGETAEEVAEALKTNPQMMAPGAHIEVVDILPMPSYE